MYGFVTLSIDQEIQISLCICLRAAPSPHLRTLRLRLSLNESGRALIHRHAKGQVEAYLYLTFVLLFITIFFVHFTIKSISCVLSAQDLHLKKHFKL